MDRRQALDGDHVVAENRQLGISIIQQRAGQQARIGLEIAAAEPALDCQGFLWPKLLFYFLVGVAFGTTAYLTNSILPAIPVHFLGLLIFFTLIWPNDAKRGLVWDAGADHWFWIHLAQAIIFTVLAVFAFQRLARVSIADAGLAAN